MWECLALYNFNKTKVDICLTRSTELISQLAHNIRNDVLSSQLLRETYNCI